MLNATTALALEMASLRSFSSAWRVALITSKAAEEGKRDGQLGASAPRAVDLLVAMDRALDPAAFEAMHREAEVDVVRPEVAELVLGGVVGTAGGGHASDPLEELQARGRETGDIGAKVEGAEGAVGGDGAASAVSSADCQAVPEE